MPLNPSYRRSEIVRLLLIIFFYQCPILYSNGCIGIGEAASWIVYYHAPAGTRIRIRYDLRITDSTGSEQRLPDIYGYEN